MRNGQADSRQDPATLTLARLPDGGFRLEGEGRNLEAVATAHGWVVRGLAEGRTWLLSRGRGGGHRVLYRGPAVGAAEIARTTRCAGEPGAPASLLTEDGRLFRIVPAAPGAGCMELLGWEGPGAYLRARPSGESWTIRKTAAGSALCDDGGIVILFAAEILEAPGPSTEP